MKVNRFLTATAAAGLLISGIIFTGPAAAGETTIKIGNIIPLSGPSASVGQQGKNAREMAVEEINASGGIKSLGGPNLKCSMPIPNPSRKEAYPRLNG